MKKTTIRPPALSSLITGGMVRAVLLILSFAGFMALCYEAGFPLSPGNVASALVCTALLGLAVQKLTTARIAFKGLLLMSVSLAFLLALVGLITHVTRQNEAAQVWFLHSKDVLSRSQSFSRSLWEAQSSVRGYAVTGDSTFASSYTRCKEEIPRTATDLQNLVADNPTQEAHARRLQGLASREMNFLAEVVRLARTGKRERAVAQIASTAGKQEMDAFTRELTAFSLEEERLGVVRQRELQRAWQRVHQTLLVGTVMDILMTLMLSVVFGQAIGSRLQTLTRNAHALGSGEDLLAPLTGRDEMVELDRVFRQMGADLGAAARKERALVENALDVICSIDAEGRFTSINSASLQVWGYRPEELLGRLYMDHVAPEDVAKTAEAALAIESGQAVAAFENRYCHRNGSLVYMAWSAFWSEEDALMFCVARDISDAKGAEEALERAHRELRRVNDELELRVQERTADLALVNDYLLREVAQGERTARKLMASAAELERSNRELQDFASVASHDLQEPLRKIQAFGDRLQTKCGEMLSKDGRDYLERMQNAAGRMQVLINDLLTFSRVTTQAQPFEPADLPRIAREVVLDLEVSIERAGARLEIGDLPAVEADPLQMRQLLQNLIGNALKFRRPGVSPVVKVHGVLLPRSPRTDQQEEAPTGVGGPRLCQILVEDNGIGFDQKYLDRIFTVFQRLHGRSEFEGTGVGLAVCRKIVERHGGTITATSTPGQGSTFIVTLPIKQVADPGRSGQGTPGKGKADEQTGKADHSFAGR